jgi:hypothetical protein
MNISPRKRRFALSGAVVLMVAAAVAIGWLIGDGGTKTARAAEPVEFVPAAATQDDPFTPPADVHGSVTIEGSGPFGGSGSDFVCDREKLIRYLLAQPDRMRAWAKVHAIPATAAAVARYIRALRPATLTAPTRVTNHSYVDGRAIAFQAILAAGTAVLVDRQGAIRARCRCGNPLLDPVMTASETCRGCPAKLPSSWRLAPSYYALHPSPPRINGKGWQISRENGVVGFRVVRTLAPSYLVQQTVRDSDGTERSDTVRFPAVKPKIRTRVVVKKRTVPGPTRVIQVPVVRTVTIVKRVPVIRYITKTKTVYVDEG